MGELDNLAPDFAARVGPWLAAVRGSGVAVDIVSGYRSSAQQRALRVQNCPDPDNSPSSDCTPPTAKVGSSLHEQGRAVDVGPSSAYGPAAAAAAAFGLEAPVGGEPWHFQAAAGGGPAPTAAPPAASAGPGATSGGPATGAGGALTFLGWLTSAGWWKRAGLAALGLWLAIAGFFWLKRHTIVSAAKLAAVV